MRFVVCSLSACTCSEPAPSEVEGLAEGSAVGSVGTAVLAGVSVLLDLTDRVLACILINE